VVFQKSTPGASHIVIISISAQPQSNNECSSFTVHIMNVTDLVTKQVQSTFFVSVTLEAKDDMRTIRNLLCGCCNLFTGAVDNKHNVKNDRYQLIGGSSGPHDGKYVAGVDLIQQVGVQKIFSL
jgi:hypothetical protein